MTISILAVADLRGREGRALGGPNSFNFMQFLEKFGKIVCWRPLEGWRPHLGEILDPPLLRILTDCFLLFIPSIRDF